jgi:hypothetical protein
MAAAAYGAAGSGHTRRACRCRAATRGHAGRGPVVAAVVTVRPAVLAVSALLVGLPVTMFAVRWSVEGSWPSSELPASWQMYSVVAPASYEGVDGAGRARPLPVRALPPVVRAVGTGRVVPDRLCARHPDVVVVRRTGGPEPGTFRC